MDKRLDKCRKTNCEECRLTVIDCNQDKRWNMGYFFYIRIFSKTKIEKELDYIFNRNIYDI